MAVPGEWVLPYVTSDTSLARAIPLQLLPSKPHLCHSNLQCWAKSLNELCKSGFHHMGDLNNSIYFLLFFFYVFSFFLVPHQCLPHYLSHNTCLQTPFYSLSIRITSKQISQVTSESGACCYLSLQAEDPPPERSGHSPGVK